MNMGGKSVYVFVRSFLLFGLFVFFAVWGRVRVFVAVWADGVFFFFVLLFGVLPVCLARL